MKHCLLPAVCCLLAVGCMGINANGTRLTPPPAAFLPDTPTAKDLVAHLNQRTAAINSLESHEVEMDLKSEAQSGVVHGDLYCQKPRNFRLRAQMPIKGTKLADIGSNDREFWYWFDDKPPDLYHCSYADLAGKQVRLPLPLHPDWMLEALGIGAPVPIGTDEEEQARNRSFKVEKSKDNHYLDMYERTMSLQGQPVVKITRLNNFNATGKVPQVVGYFLYDGQNHLVCKASINEAQVDKRSGISVPRRIEFAWPDMKLSMLMTLDKIAVNDPELASKPKLFLRPQISNARDVDLARGNPTMQPTGIQRAGAFR
ncbi:MAG TPA: hypothetical protein VH120_02300 [Gemmataceae bacterium]|nr:hypothetical protein [Gemmataceae bacterium]